jgi:predicted TIM-barrel fold metal-dependent hydrolase
VEFCGTTRYSHAIRGAVDVVGPWRPLFGTDLNFIDPAFLLGGYADAAFTPDERQLIMYDNARRLFGL